MKTMYTCLLTGTLLLVSFSKAAETQQPSLWQLAKDAYNQASQYIQENPETVNVFKKQFLTGQTNNYTQADKDALTAKLRAKWQQSGTNKSFEDWVQEKAALNA
jgi:hypothetical protein